MAGARLKIGSSICFIDFADGEGEAVIDGQKYRWDFAEYTGPGFFKIIDCKYADGEHYEHEEYFIPDEESPLWPIFDKWLSNYRLTHPHPSELPGARKRIKLDIK